MNSPVLNDDGSVQCIIHRVEDVTEFLKLKRMEAEHGRLAETERIRADKMEAELFLRSRELSEIKQLTKERQHAEDRTAGGEDRFQLLAENITDVFWLTDFPQTRVLYVSPSVKDVAGLSQDVFNGALDAWNRLIHPTTRIVCTKPSRRICLRQFNVEYRLRSLSGEQRWIFDRAFPIRDAAGGSTESLVLLKTSLPVKETYAERRVPPGCGLHAPACLGHPAGWLPRVV